MLNKLYIKAINYTYFKLEEKATTGVKNDKSNFIDVIGNKLAMSIK